MVAFASRQLWRRVGGPIALLGLAVGRVTRGRLSDPIPPSPEAVRELADLMDGFNLMQGEVRQERDAVAAAARREAAQKTERALWETVQNGLLPERLPAVRGLRLAARYRPAERALLVGGDFYDAMVLPGRAPGRDGRRHGRPRGPGGRPGRGPALRVAHAGRGQPQPGRGDGRPQRADGPARPAGRGPVRLDHLHAHRLRAAR